MRFAHARDRRGSIALVVGVLLVSGLLLGVLALSYDVGYMMMTQSELQSASDMATLSGGTEILAGLGENPVAPAVVVSNGTTQAVSFAGKNRNGERSVNNGGSYADGARDVRFGWAEFNGAGWDMHWGEELSGGGYNMIGVTLRRDQPGSSNGDDPLPLVFARALGQNTQNIAVDSAAVIMPANGISIPPGSPTTSNVIPFALDKRVWDKYLVAQEYFDNNGFPSPVESILYDEGTETAYNPDLGGDPDPSTSNDQPLFGHMVQQPGNQDPDFVQDFDDQYSCNCDPKDPTAGISGPGVGDSVLEIDIYPKDDYTSGNFGTVDIGGSNNSTADIERQIVHGINDQDLADFIGDTGQTFEIPQPDGSQLVVDGDTGISAGIKDELDLVQGQCRAILMFESVASPGNTSQFTICGLQGVRLMHSELNGNLEFKHLIVQKCNATLTGSTFSDDPPDGEDTTVFTPLILIE